MMKLNIVFPEGFTLRNNEKLRTKLISMIDVCRKKIGKEFMREKDLITKDVLEVLPMLTCLKKLKIWSVDYTETSKYIIDDADLKCRKSRKRLQDEYSEIYQQLINNNSPGLEYLELRNMLFTKDFLFNEMSISNEVLLEGCKGKNSLHSLL